MRLTREDSLLLVIDIQRKLAPAIQDHERVTARTEETRLARSRRARPAGGVAPERTEAAPFVGIRRSDRRIGVADSQDRRIEASGCPLPAQSADADLGAGP